MATKHDRPLLRFIAICLVFVAVPLLFSGALSLVVAAFQLLVLDFGDAASYAALGIFNLTVGGLCIAPFFHFHR